MKNMKKILLPIIKDLKTYDEIKEYKTNYQKYGLERMSVYD